MNRLLLLCSLLYPVHSVVNYEARIRDVGETEYELTIEWDHDPTTAVMVAGSYNAGSDDPRLAGPCGLGSEEISPVDNLPYWFPRLFSRPVSEEITQKTGIKYASLDWQPCGHKDIVICHAESHYDIHLYYVTPEEQAGMDCELPPAQGQSNTALPQCKDSATNAKNHAYFKLIKKNLPARAKITDQTVPNTYASNTDPSMQQTPLKDHTFDFCVDPSSGIMGSGMHFGDKSETLNEWRSPVTIIGSHDCKMSFFEPMVSWNWITNRRGMDQSWPVWETQDMEYTEKTFTALPTRWSIRASEGCRSCSSGSTIESCNCHLKLVVRGQRCDQPGANCEVKKECITCGDTNTKDCLTGMPYSSPWMGEEECDPTAPVAPRTAPPTMAMTPRPTMMTPRPTMMTPRPTMMTPRPTDPMMTSPPTMDMTPRSPPSTRPPTTMAPRSSMQTPPPSVQTPRPTVQTPPPTMTMRPSAPHMDGDGDGGDNEMMMTQPPSSMAPVVPPSVDPSAPRLTAADVSSALEPLVGSTAGGRIVEGVSSVQSEGERGYVEVEVTLAGDASTFTAKDRQDALDLFAMQLSIPVTRFGDVQVRVGSLILSFRILNPPIVIGIANPDEDCPSLAGWLIAVIVVVAVVTVVGLGLLVVYLGRNKDTNKVAAEKVKPGRDVEAVIKAQPLRVTPTDEVKSPKEAEGEDAEGKEAEIKDTEGQNAEGESKEVEVVTKP